MINYVVYSHTDYMDVLNIQTSHIKEQKNITLFLNSNTLELGELYSKYKNVIFYDDSKPYATRLLMSINKLDCDYFLFMHDIDILLNVDNSVLDGFLPLMVEHSIDRIDLKHTDSIDHPEVISIDDGFSFGSSAMMVDGKNYMIKQTNPNNFIYNVNPSIWKKDSFMDLLNTFPDKTYRTIEGMDVQNFSTKLNVYKLHNKNYKYCGYFTCVEFFIFLHISHSGKLLPLNDTFTTVYGQSYNDISVEYTNIVNKYNLKLNEKWIS